MKKNSLLLLPLLAILALSCKKEQTPAPLKIGDFHQGGYVFYLDSTSEHGMVMAPPETEQSLQWGCYGILMDFGNPNITAEFGWGEYCTSRMVIKCNEPYAAGRYCYNLESGGFKDWFMPNLREWLVAYNNAGTVVGLNLKPNISYWVAYEADANRGTSLNSSNLSIGHFEIKTNLNLVRAVRKF